MNGYQLFIFLLHLGVSTLFLLNQVFELLVYVQSSASGLIKT